MGEVKPVKPEKTEAKVEGDLLAKVSHYFSKAQVAAFRVAQGKLAVGDRIRITGHTTNFEQVVESIQMEHQSVQNAKKGDEIGIKVKDHAREGDSVYKL